MEDPASRRSINRKIAQLTKVIFRLSSVQEDHDLHLKALTDAYEQEIEEILLSANHKIQQCKQAAEQAALSTVTERVSNNNHSVAIYLPF